MAMHSIHRAMLAGLLAGTLAISAAERQVPRYNDAGELLRPDDYREWVWLTSGLGMTYGPAAAAAGQAKFFDNVFVEPDAWRSFRQTGAWPDKTMFVLEIRYSQSSGSINKDGFFQTDVRAFEMAVKDTTRFPQDKWAYFNFPTLGGAPAASGAAMPKTAGCYACHTANGAVENTFTQFYPTALEIARAKGTVRPTLRAWAPSPAKLYHTVATDGWPAAKTALDRAKAEEPAAAVLQEPALNSVGYQLLASGRKQEALEVFRHTVSEFPNSANASDSLAEALEAAGEREAALAASKRTLQLISADAALPAPRREALTKAASERMTRLNKR